VVAKAFIQSHRNDILCLLAISALATLLLAPALRPGYTLLPLGGLSKVAPWHKQMTQVVQNPLISDPLFVFYPPRHFATSLLRQGIYPLWNPYIFGGHPALGDVTAQTFYPSNLVAALFLSAARALPILAWFHLVITGIFAFGFLRTLDLGSGTALFGAVAWMLNGNMIVWLENPYRLSTLAWMPGVFLFYELAIRRRRIWPGIVAGLLYALSILGGHTQFALGIGMALAAYALLRTATLSWAERRLVKRPLLLVVLVGLLGVGVGLVQLLPAYQFASMSHRDAMSVERFVNSGWPLMHAISLWLPDFYGSPVGFPYWGEANYAEMTVYYGAFVFPLSLAALLWTRRAECRFFALGLIVVFLIVLASPVSWLIAWMPGIRYFRKNSLIAYLPFLGAVAAAFGLEAVSTGVRQRWKVWGPILAILMGLIVATVLIARIRSDKVIDYWDGVGPQLWRTGLIWSMGIGCLLLVRRRPNVGVFLLVALVAIDLLQWGMPFNPVNSLDILYPENDVTAWLRQDTSMYRVLPLQVGRPVFGPNVLSVFGFYETGGYSSLKVNAYQQLVKAIDSTVSIPWMGRNANMLVNSRFDPLFSVLNVKYVLTSGQIKEPLISVDAAYSGCVEPGLTLQAGERITRTFRALHPGLNRVDIDLVRAASDDQPVRFLLWRDREGGELIADVTQDGAGVTEQDLLVFFFAPVPDSAGQTFVWGLETEGAGQVAICQAEGAQAGQATFRAYSVQLQLADIQQGMWIYENPNVLPRAYVVHRVEVVPFSTQLDRLTSSDFNVWTTALIESPLPSEQMAALETAPSRSHSVARITRYDPLAVELDAEMEAPGVLVLSDTHYPGWEVIVDGVAAPLLRVNHALRGVYLSQGTHRIVFRFVPSMFYMALIVSSLVLACGVGVIVWDVRGQAELKTCSSGAGRSIRQGDGR
jgi:hypothetical protein